MGGGSRPKRGKKVNEEVKNSSEVEGGKTPPRESPTDESNQETPKRGPGNGQQTKAKSGEFSESIEKSAQKVVNTPKGTTEKPDSPNNTGISVDGKRRSRSKSRSRSRSVSRRRRSETVTTPVKGKGKGASKGKAKAKKRARTPELSDSASLSSESDLDVSFNAREKGEFPSGSTSYETESDSSSDRRSRRRSRVKASKKRSRRRSRTRSRSRGRSRAKKRQRRRHHYSRSSSSSSSEGDIARIISEVKKQLKGSKKKSRKRGKGSDPKGSSRTNNVPVASPSNETIFAPAVPLENSGSPNLRKAVNKAGKSKEGNPSHSSANNSYIIDFLKRIRLGDRETKPASRRNRGSSSSSDEGQSSRYEEDRRHRQARDRAEAAVVEAEKYKASVENQGKMTDKDVDDEFFHTSCHVELSLRERIGRGEFVELEKLLRKIRAKYKRDESKLEMFNKGGTVFCMESEDKECKITNIHKWDQAFRVYATIYSKANPSRAAEIWQYVETIHRAARKFAWDSVAEYDFIFRHLMAEYPQRSWAKTYTQEWNLMLCDVPQRGEHKNPQGGTKKENVCWKYNKTHCPYGANCRFPHRCSYCGGSHPKKQCSKKGKKNKAAGAAE